MTELRFLVRSLTHKPVFTIASILTLSLVMAGASTLFSLLDGVLLQPLPYSDPQRLVAIWLNNKREGIDRYPLSYPDYVDYRQQAGSYEALAAVISFQWNAVLGGQPEASRVAVQHVSGSLFPMLGIQALHGRVLTPADDRPDSPLAVVLSHRLWSRRFSSDPAAVGKAIPLDGQSATVIGVLPPDFRLFQEADLWAPLASNPNTRRNRRFQHWLRVVGKLSEGVTAAQAERELQAIAARLEQAYPSTNKDLGARMVPLQEEVVGGSGTALLILFGAGICLLLIANANLSSLMSARVSARRLELAIRRSLGGSRLDLAKRLFIEGLALTLAGALTGLLLAIWAVQLVQASAPQDLPRLHEAAVNWRTAGFALLAAALSTLLFCLPAFVQACRADWVASLSGGRHSPGKAARQLQRWMVRSEIAVALTLLISAGLLMRSFERLQGTDLGFQPGGLLSQQIRPPGHEYDSDSKRKAFSQQLMQALEGIAALDEVALSRDIPLRGRSTTRLELRERPIPAEQHPEVDFRAVTREYFQVMRIPLMQGRPFSASNSEQRPREAIVNQSAARLLWKGSDPLGKHFRYSGSGDDAPWWRVIGTVADILHDGADSSPYAEVYFHLADDPPGNPWIVARTAIDLNLAALEIREAVGKLDRNVVIEDALAMQDLIAERLAPRRFNTVLLGAFALLATILALTGVYGLVAYTMAQRQREIGIRVALGGTPRDISRAIFSEGAKLTASGLALGLAASWGATRLLESLLYGVSSTDPWTFLGASLLFLSASLLAHGLPAQKASRIDAWLALRRG